MLPNLLAEMKRHKIRYKDIYEKTGIPISSLTNKTTGNVKIQFDEAKKIRDAFFPDLDADYLFAEQPKPIE